MKILLIICTCFFIKICYGQRYKFRQNDSSHIYEATNATVLSLNINSKGFTRILDGFRLKENKIIPKNIRINTVRRLSDTFKLKNIGIKDFKKPYMFLSSFASDTRRFVYSKADIDYKLQEINLPIILNNKLITFSKYSLIDNLDTNQISTVKYIKPDKIFLKNYFEMPLGIIQVTTDTQNKQ